MLYTRKASGGTGTVTDMMQEMVGTTGVVLPSAAPLGIRAAKLRIIVERNLETQVVEMLVASDGTVAGTTTSIISNINTGTNLANFTTTFTTGAPAGDLYVRATATGAGNYYTVDLTRYYQMYRD